MSQPFECTNEADYLDKLLTRNGFRHAELEKIYSNKR